MTKRVVDRLAIKCCVTLAEELVKGYPKEFPEAMVQALAKHPKLDHQLKVAKGLICEDTSIEIVKGNGDSVVVPIKYTGTEYVRFFTHMLEVFASDPHHYANLGFDDRDELVTFFEYEFGYGAMDYQSGDINKHSREFAMVDNILDDWGNHLLEERITDEEKARVDHWKQHGDLLNYGFAGEHPEREFLDWYHTEKVCAITAQFDGNENTGQNAFGPGWFDSLVETMNAKPDDEWIATPLRRLKFGWL